VQKYVADAGEINDHGSRTSVYETEPRPSQSERPRKTSPVDDILGRVSEISKTGKTKRPLDAEQELAKNVKQRLPRDQRSRN